MYEIKICETKLDYKTIEKYPFLICAISFSQHLFNPSILLSRIEYY